jgi:hypothetical protein
VDLAPKAMPIIRLINAISGEAIKENARTFTQETEKRCRASV